MYNFLAHRDHRHGEQQIPKPFPSTPFGSLPPDLRLMILDLVFASNDGAKANVAAGYNRTAEVSTSQERRMMNPKYLRYHTDIRAKPVVRRNTRQHPVDKDYFHRMVSRRAPLYVCQMLRSEGLPGFFLYTTLSACPGYCNSTRTIEKFFQGPVGKPWRPFVKSLDVGYDSYNRCKVECICLYNIVSIYGNVRHISFNYPLCSHAPSARWGCPVLNIRGLHAMQSGDLWLTPPANVHRIFATGCFKDIRDAHDMGGLKFLFKDPQPSDLSSGKPEGLLQMQLFHRTRFGSLPSAIRKRINNHIFGVVLPQTTADRKARRVVWASTSSNLQKRHPVMAAVDVLLVCRKMNLEATEVFHKHFQLAFQDIPYAADYLNTLKPLKRRMIEDIHFTDGFADWWATEPCHLKRLPNLRQLSFNFVGPRAFKSDCYVLDGKEDPSRQDDGDMTETDVALADSSSMADLFDDEFAIIAWRRSSLSTSPHLLRLFSAHVVKTVRKQLLYDADSKLLLAKEKITTTKPTRIAGRKKKRKVKSYFGIDKDDISEREYESMVHIVTENF